MVRRLVLGMLLVPILGHVASGVAQQLNSQNVRMFETNTGHRHVFRSKDGHECGFSVSSWEVGSWWFPNNLGVYQMPDGTPLFILNPQPSLTLPNLGFPVPKIVKEGTPLASQQAKKDAEEIFSILVNVLNFSKDMERKVTDACIAKGGLMAVRVVRDDPEVDVGTHYRSANLIIIDIGDIEKLQEQMTVVAPAGTSADVIANAKIELRSIFTRSLLAHEWDHAAYGHPDPQGRDAAMRPGDAGNDENQVLAEQRFRVKRLAYITGYRGRPVIPYEVGINVRGGLQRFTVLLEASALSDTKHATSSEARFGSADASAWNSIHDHHCNGGAGDCYRPVNIESALSPNPTSSASIYTCQGPLALAPRKLSTPDTFWYAERLRKLGPLVVLRTLDRPGSKDLINCAGPNRIGFSIPDPDAQAPDGGPLIGGDVNGTVNWQPKQPITLTIGPNRDMVALEPRVDANRQDVGSVLSHADHSVVVARSRPPSLPWVGVGFLTQAAWTIGPGTSTSPVVRLLLARSAPRPKSSPPEIVIDPARQPMPGGNVKLFFISKGTIATANSVRLIAINETGRRVAIGGDLLALRPVTGITVADVERLARTSTGKRVEMEVPAYCLQKDKAPPRADQVFIPAASDLQMQYNAMRRIVQATHLLAEAKQLTPDAGDPAEYAHFIRQWAIWSSEKRYTEKTFGDALVEHTKKNASDAGQRWTSELDKMVRGLVPGRWRHIALAIEHSRALDDALRSAAARQP